LKDRLLLAILALALVLYLVGIGWGLPYNISWSIDDISPWKPLTLPWRWFESFHKYPYLHWFLSLLLYSPYLAWLMVTGKLDSSCLPTILPEEQCFADPVGAPTVLMLISRLLSALMGVGVVAGVYLLSRELLRDRLAALFAALIAAVSYILVLYAHLGNLDVPVTFWFAISLVFFARIAGGGSRRDHLAFGLFAACALATKDSIIGAYALTCLAIWIVHVRRHRRIVDADLLGLAAVLVVVYALVQNALFNWSGFVEHWKLWLPTGEFMEGQRRSSPGYAQLQARFLRALAGSMGVPLLVLCAAGLPYACWRRPRTALLLVPAVSYILFSLVLSAFIAERFMIPLVVILAVFGGVLASALVRAPRARIAGVPLVALALGHGLLYALHGDLVLRNDSRYRAEEWLRANADPSARVASCSVPVDLPRMDRLGFRPEFVPPDESCAEGLRARRPDYVIVSSASRRGFRSGRSGYRVLWKGRGHSPLDRWFGTPVSWVNPRISVLAPELASPRGSHPPARTGSGRQP
jgi:4-amino-4-deoxy-L-arabinose transferase-like glycosyltransferase